MLREEALSANHVSHDWDDFTTADWNALKQYEEHLTRQRIKFSVIYHRTDEGEPWAAFVNLETGATLLHICRCDNGYAAFGDVIPPLERANIPSLIRALIHGGKSNGSG